MDTERRRSVDGMRSVESLSARRTLVEILAELENTGHAETAFDELRVDVKDWQALAREAGRALHRPVGIRIDEGNVTAELRDWPRDDEERALTVNELRESIDALVQGHRRHPE